MSEIPQKLGKYHILELLAQGGMAEVYKAKTVGIAGFEKILALKRIRPRFASEARFIRNFIDEARIAVSLNHRNIVQVFDFGKAEGELYLAMELLDGIDLRHVIKLAAEQGVGIPRNLSCYVLSELAAGLDYAHRKCDADGTPLGIVHCDVSPHNILLSTEGYVKILDFGVARARFTAAPTSKRLRGKPRYMAPEQTLGEPPSAASDVFVLGILAWELMTGKNLFKGKELKEILKAVRRADVPPLHTMVTGIPQHLSDAVARALNPDASKRGSAADLGTHLAQASRELEPGTSARTLADWLEDLLYPAPQEDVSVTDVQIELPPDILNQGLQGAVSEVTVTRPRLQIEDTSPTKVRPAAPEAPPLPPPPSSISRAESQHEESRNDESEIEDLAALDDGSEEPGNERTGDSADAPLPGLSALIDRRRVVLTTVLLDGGNDDRRSELSRSLVDLAYKRGAVVHAHSDTELVAIFGLEVAGEDDVASAMHFAMDAVELAEHSTLQGEAPILVRSAARAGIVAKRRQGDYHIRGDAWSETQDLAAGAEPGRPLLSGGASRLATAQFRFRELPHRRYRSRRLRVLELVGPRTQDDRLKTMRARRSCFVGRKKELATLLDFYHSAVKEDEQRIAWANLSGETGAGKSHLIGSFLSELESEESPPRTTVVAAVESGSDAPYSLVIEYLQAILGTTGARGDKGRAELGAKVTSLLRAAGHSAAKIAEGAQAVEQAMELRDGAYRERSGDAERLRESFRASLQLIREALFADRPGLTVLDDAHRADRMSMGIFARLGATPKREVFVLTSREPLPPKDDTPPSMVLELGDLDPEERDELIADRLGEQASDELVEAVARRAGGNPLYIEELCRTIRDIGWDETPATIQDSIMARVDRLSKRSRAVLQRAAVIGGDFRGRILEELVGTPVAAHLEELVSEGMLELRDDTDPVGDEGVLCFPHGLIQEVVYSHLAAGSRQATHAKLGQILALRDEAGRAEPPAVIARHLELGGLNSEAASYWGRAGFVALAAFEPTKAREAFERSVRMIRELQKEDPQRSLGPEQEFQLIESLLGREQANRELGDVEAQAQDLKELAGLCGGNPVDEAVVLSRLSTLHLRRADYHDAIAAADQAIAAADISRDQLTKGDALRVKGEAFERLGQFEPALEATGQALGLAERMGAIEQEMSARIGIARIHLSQAHFSEALGIYQPVFQELEKTPNPGIERIARKHLALIELAGGRFQSAMANIQRSLDLCLAEGDPIRRADSQRVKGLILTQVGQFQAAKSVLDSALAALDPQGTSWQLAHCKVAWAMCETNLGNFGPALAALEEAHSMAKDMKAPYLELSSALAMASFFLLRDGEGDAASAERVASDAAERARAAALPGFQATALSRQAEAIRRRGGAHRGLVVSVAALKILDRHRQLEDPEEEVLFHHFAMLSDEGRPDADEALGRALRTFERKLEGLENPEWRRSFSEEVPLNQAILDASEH